MKKRRHVFTYALLCLCIITTILFVRPIQIEASVSELDRLSDYADILTDNEESLLCDELTTISQKYDIDVIVLTISNAGNYDLLDYTDNLYSSNNFAKNTIILVVNMDPDNREILVKGYEDCYNYVNQKRAQHITDSMVSNMKAGEYYKGILQYIDSVDYFYNHKNPTATPIQLLLELGGAILIAGIIVFIMVRNAGGKDTTTCSTYMDTSTSKLLAKQDIYTHTTTTRHKIESNNSSHSGGGGSSGGAGRSSF